MISKKSRRRDQLGKANEEGDLKLRADYLVHIGREESTDIGLAAKLFVWDVWLTIIGELACRGTRATRPSVFLASQSYAPNLPTG